MSAGLSLCWLVGEAFPPFFHRWGKNGPWGFPNGSFCGDFTVGGGETPPLLPPLGENLAGFGWWQCFFVGTMTFCAGNDVRLFTLREKTLYVKSEKLKSRKTCKHDGKSQPKKGMASR